MRHLILSAVLTLLACPAPADDAKEAIVAPMEAAHAKDTYDRQAAVKADFDVDFGGGDLIAGTMWFTPWLDKVRMELEDGTVLVWDGGHAWRSPADAAELPYGARFHLITWPYFMALPFKLSDPGVHHEYVPEAPISPNRVMAASRMTFDAGVGDAPDDWYLVIPDPTTHRLKAAAYIVTYGTPAEEANQKPSIVVYSDYTEVQGVPFATTWTFFYWDPKQGPEPQPKGVAKLTNLAFVAPPAGAFEKPQDAAESMPPAEQ